MPYTSEENQMSLDEVQSQNYLQQLYQMSRGDSAAEVSMYDIGAALGLDRPEAGAIAEDLIIDGYAELRNLTGGISITSAGLRLLKVDAGSTADGSSETKLLLGETELLGPEVVEAVAALVDELKKAITEGGFDYEQVEELVIDIKSLEIHLLSSRPKTAIVREILRSAANLLAEKESCLPLAEHIRQAIAGS